jgi:hypothetical protein
MHYDEVAGKDWLSFYERNGFQRNYRIADGVGAAA